MNKKTNCLIVGCGGIGRHHFSSLSKTPNVHLFGVDKSRSSLDILEKRLQEEGVSKGGVTLSEDLEITKGEKIKFAVIATPSRGRVKVL
ncbi:MAG: Gfo/Idh/MocA family oxidoreductase, partial [Halobacteriovoraceae bacterium]|nr:Gfo/Idh/MocA family oxidoreductase [Halobacteriovoraceae bacterium]